MSGARTFALWSGIDNTTIGGVRRTRTKFVHNPLTSSHLVLRVNRLCGDIDSCRRCSSPASVPASGYRIQSVVLMHYLRISLCQSDTRFGSRRKHSKNGWFPSPAHSRTVGSRNDGHRSCLLHSTQGVWPTTCAVIRCPVAAMSTTTSAVGGCTQAQIHHGRITRLGQVSSLLTSSPSAPPLLLGACSIAFRLHGQPECIHRQRESSTRSKLKPRAGARAPTRHTAAIAMKLLTFSLRIEQP